MALKIRFISKHASIAIQTFKILQRTSHVNRKTDVGLGFVGRDFIDPTYFSPNELHSLLWTALDLKSIMKDRKFVNLNLLAGKSITILLSKPCMKSQLAYPNAARMLGATSNVIVDSTWEQSPCVADLGRFLATQCDIIFSLGNNHEKTCSLADGSSRPVLSILSGKLAPIVALTDIMTIYEHFGKLKKLKLAYVGPYGPLLNTYMLMLPTFGLNMHFFAKSAKENVKSNSMFEMGLRSCQLSNTGIKECINLSDAIYRCDVIATVPHTLSNMCITLKDLKEAAVDWALLHSLPRTDCEVTSDVFYDKRSLAFPCAANTVWVVMALMLQMSCDYEPKMKKPNFDGDTHALC